MTPRKVVILKNDNLFYLRNMSNDSTKSVGLRIRDIRTRKEISQTEAGKKAELKHRQYMWLIENGQNKQMSTLHKASQGLELSIAYLVDIKNEIKFPVSLARLEKIDAFTLRKKIGENILKVCDEMGLFHVNVCKHLKKDKMWLELRLNGTVDYTLTTLELIATAIGVSMAKALDIYGEIKDDDKSYQTPAVN
jgi:transcriptional regulator with XRE-family HTH domain